MARIGSAMSRIVPTPGRTPVRTLVAFVRVKQDRGRIDAAAKHWLSDVQMERKPPKPGRLTSGAAQI